MGKKLYFKKLPLALFLLVVVIAVSGTATAAVDLNAPQPEAYVVESGKVFTGPTAIQDSIDSSSTRDGYKVYLQPGDYYQQVTVTKSITIKGMGANPEDTKIEINTDGNVINVPDGVTVTLKNLAIINTGTGKALSDTGIINLINCVVTENYVEPPVEGSLTGAPVVSDTNESVYSEVMIPSTLNADTNPSTTTLTTESPLTTLATDETTTLTNINTPINTNETNTTGSSEPLDGSIPLTTLAYGMLMVVGGVVLPRKNEVKDLK